MSPALQGLLGSAAKAATFGAAASLITGGDPIKGATMGFVTGGALGVATVEVSLDNGSASGGGGTSLGVFGVPAGGNVCIPNAGFFITGVGPFTAGEYHTFLATPPGPAAADITSAITALRTNASVTALMLGFSEIGAAGAQAIGEALRTNTSVTTLNL